MRDFVIVTDSGCDLAQNVVESLGVGIAPMGLNIDNKTYRHYHDFRELGKEEFYNKIRAGKIGTTAGVNIQDAMDAMREPLSKGMDVLYLSFSSGMSCSYQSAVNAANELKEEFSDANIRVIDTLSGCVGLGMMAYLAAKKKADGETMNQIADWAETHKQNICHYFMVDDLMYIQKTGRTSHLTAFVGTMLGIKPIFKLDENGKVKDDAKIRGKKAGVKHMLSRMQETCADQSLFFIAHADVDDEAEKLKNQILEIYPNTEVIVNCVGPILGNNVGPGALALIFYGKHR
jgi:DegV family protein with EDD domain